MNIEHRTRNDELNFDCSNARLFDVHDSTDYCKVLTAYLFDWGVLFYGHFFERDFLWHFNRRMGVRSVRVLGKEKGRIRFAPTLIFKL